MTALTDTDRLKVNEIVRRLMAKTVQGKIDWGKSDDTWAMSTETGHVLIQEDRIKILKSWGGPAVVDEKDYPGVDHLWALLESRREEAVNRTIQAILADLNGLERRPPTAYAAPPRPAPAITSSPDAINSSPDTDDRPPLWLYAIGVICLLVIVCLIILAVVS